MSEFSVDTNGIVNEFLAQADRAIVTDAMQRSLEGVLRRNQESLLASVEDNTQAEVGALTRQLGESLTDLSQAWLEEGTNQLCLVPEGTRYFAREGNYMNVLTEYAPGLRRIIYRRNGERGEPITRVYELAMPFTQFVTVFRSSGRTMTFDSVRASCSKSPVTSLEQQVHKLPLPNVGLGGPFQICTGRGTHGMSVGSGSMSVIDKVNTTVTGFWQSEFNTDLSEPMLNFLIANFGLEATQRGNNEAVFAALDRWQERSRQNPHFMLEDDASVNLGSTVRIGTLLISDITTRQGKTAFKNRVKTTISNGITSLTERLCGTLRATEVNDSNVPAVHGEAIKATLVRWLDGGVARIQRAYHDEYMRRWNEVHIPLRERESSIGRREARLESDRARLRTERSEYEKAKLREQVQVHAAHVALQRKEAELNERERALAQAGQNAPVTNQTQTQPTPVPTPVVANATPAPRTRRPRRQPATATQAVRPDDPTAPRGPGQVRVTGSIWDDLDADMLVG